jgi:hypothetical protein
MKRTLFVATMFTGITNFAADLQDSNKSSGETTSFPENTQHGGFLNTLFSTPGAMLRHLDTYNNPETHKKMFGLDNHLDCEEHKKTKTCAEYFRQIASQIPLKIAIDTEMQKRLDKRCYICAVLSRRILTEQKQSDIGDLKSSYTITRIDRLLDCYDVFGSNIFKGMLEKHKEMVQKNLAPFVPEKKASLSEPRNILTQNPTNQASPQQNTPTQPAPTPTIATLQAPVPDPTQPANSVTALEKKQNDN